MEKAGRLFVLILACLLVIGCGKKDSKKEDISYTDGKLKLIIYINPTGDCVACTLKALAVLDRTMAPGEKFTIFMKSQGDKKQEDIENFKTFIKEKYPNREFSFSRFDLKIPHPSVLLAKNNSIYMYFYIPNDPYILAENINLAMEFLVNLSNHR